MKNNKNFPKDMPKDFPKNMKDMPKDFPKDMPFNGKPPKRKLDGNVLKRVLKL